MTLTVFILASVITVVLVVCIGWRWTDLKADDRLWARLVSIQPAEPNLFDSSMIAGLPTPAQRYFRFAIKPGTPLYTVAEIFMEGEFGLGNPAEPRYMPMNARQVLGLPHGFVWKMSAGRGVMRISGSDAAEDGESWSRFWLLNLVPLARAGGDSDHARSAFGRYVAEAAFWTPAALLPGENTRWESIDESSSRVTLTHMGMEQAVDLHVGDDGRPHKVVFQRWTNANPAKKFRFQPFGGYLSEFADFDGFRLPTRIEAGNFFETDEYFPFFRVNVTSIRHPAAHPANQ